MTVEPDPLDPMVLVVKQARREHRDVLAALVEAGQLAVEDLPERPTE